MHGLPEKGNSDSRLENLKAMRTARLWKHGFPPWAGVPRLGIAFVARRRTIHDLVEMISLGMIAKHSPYQPTDKIEHPEKSSI
jgi:hypothetical protein